MKDICYIYGQRKNENFKLLTSIDISPKTILKKLEFGQNYDGYVNEMINTTKENYIKTHTFILSYKGKENSEQKILSKAQLYYSKLVIQSKRIWSPNMCHSTKDAYKRPEAIIKGIGNYGIVYYNPFDYKQVIKVPFDILDCKKSVENEIAVYKAILKNPAIKQHFPGIIKLTKNKIIMEHLPESKRLQDDEKRIMFYQDNRDRINQFIQHITTLLLSNNIKPHDLNYRNIILGKEFKVIDVGMYDLMPTETKP